MTDVRLKSEMARDHTRRIMNTPGLVSSKFLSTREEIGKGMVPINAIAFVGTLFAQEKFHENSRH